MTGPQGYRFGDVEVDLRRMAVTVGGEPVPLEPKAFDVLCYLLEHRDGLVGKDDILRSVWADTFVTPNVLTRAITQLRRAIGDDAHDARYIETVSRRGYRFLVPVVEITPNGLAGAAQPVAFPATEPARAEPAASATRPSRRWIAGAGAVAVIALAGAGWWALRERDAPVPLPVGTLGDQRRLTTRIGFDAMPALSPDGRSVAFVSDRTGGFEIYVMSLAPGARETAVTADGGQNIHPAWSPDGAYLAFHSRRRRGVWVVPSTGGPARQVVDFGSDPAWSPDGAWIAFTSDAGGMAAQSVIGLVRPDGTGRREVTRIGSPPGGHREPSWSPDGRSIAFAVSIGRWSQQIWTVPAEGGEPRRVASPEQGGTFPTYGPDGALYFGAGSADRTGVVLVRQPLDGAGALSAVPLPSGQLEGLSIGRDGTFVYAIGAADANLWAVDLRADGAAAGEPVRLTSDAVRATVPDYAPDGRIAYVQAGPGRPEAIWIMAEDGTGAEVLLAESPTGRPQWSRDGRLLVTRREPEKGSFWWVDPATRRATFTGISGTDIDNARLSPDGREIAFHVIEPSGRMNVWAQPLAGGPRRRVTDDAEAASYPAWSPDGRWLTVELKRGDETQVGVVAREGGPIEQLTSEAGQSWPHTWSPDGQHIVFAAERDGVWNVWTVARRTRAMRQLTRFTSSSGYVRYPAWSPSGRRIVFERSLRTGSLWVATPAGRR